jgi:hypothetical protein
MQRWFRDVSRIRFRFDATPGSVFSSGAQQSKRRTAIETSAEILSVSPSVMSFTVAANRIIGVGGAGAFSAAAQREPKMMAADAVI